jgi:uncharacterized membrane protein
MAMINIYKSSRDQALDLMRGIAIIMMIVFHLIYDLNTFGYTNIPLSNFWLTSYWRYLIVFLFLNAVGISLVIAYGKSFSLNKFIKRLALLGLAALSVSLGTYILFPDAWVYFGILHLIWTATLIAIIFVQFPKTSLFVAALIFILGYLNLPDLSFFRFLLSDYLPLSSVDFYPLFPWIAFVFTGIYLGHNPIYKKVFFMKVPFLQLVGQHSLIIYLLHQVILFSLVGAIYFLFSQ